MSSQRIAVAVLTLLVAVPAASQTVFVQDSFTESTDRLLELHTPDVGGLWTRYAGGSGLTVNATADNLRNAAGTDFNVYGNAALAPSAEQVVRAVVTFSSSSSNNQMGLFGRASVALVSGYLATVAPSGTVGLFRVVGGTATLLAVGAASPFSNGTPHTILLSLRTASKEVWVNGVLVASSTDNTVTGAGIAGLTMTSNNAGTVIVDDFMASSLSPTAARLFAAHATLDGGRTMVEWTTSQERDSLGFHVHRRYAGERTRITKKLIGGSAFLAAAAEMPAGNSYRWLDLEAPGDAEYWLEEVDLSGLSTWHGPIRPAAGTIDDRLARSPLLGEIGQRDGVARGEFAVSMAVVARGHAAAGEASSAALATQRAIAAGPALKIAVRETGWIRVTRQELVAAGLPSGTVARGLRLFRDGVEVPMTVEPAGSGWAAIRFYGRSLDTASTDTGVYWLVWDSGRGARTAAIRSPRAAPALERSFPATVERRDREVYFAALRNGPRENFFGPLVSTDPVQQTLDVHHLDTAAPAALTVALQGATGGPHRVLVALNDEPVGEASFTGTERSEATFVIDGALLGEGENIVSLTSLEGDSDISLVESVRIQYGHTWDADDGRLLATIPAGRKVSLRGFGSPDVRVLDVTVPERPFEIRPAAASSSSVDVAVGGSGRRTILALRSDRFSPAASITSNAPSSLFRAPDHDLLMIVHPALEEAIAPLVALRESQGQSVLVAKVDDVYDEMSFGAKDPAAIASLVALLASRWRSGPDSVLIVGDASFDPRGYLGGDDADLVPTMLIGTEEMETSSDFGFADLDGDGSADLPLGRLPARDAADAAAMVAKIVAYEGATGGTWASRALFVSDSDSDIGFDRHTEEVAARAPDSYEQVAIDVAEMGANAARQALLTELDAGAALVNFFGHGSVEVWTNGGLLSRADALAAANGNRLPVVLANTCLNGYFHDLYTESLAEALLRAPDGGAVAVWASSTLTNAETQVEGAAAFVETILGDAGATLGDAMLAAQRASSGTTRRTFMLFGDPAMRLKRQ